MNAQRQISDIRFGAAVGIANVQITQNKEKLKKTQTNNNFVQQHVSTQSVAHSMYNK